MYTATVATSPTIPEDDAPADTAAEVWAGASPGVAITLTNKARQQKLGSADIAVPDGVTLTGTPVLTSSQSPFAGTVARLVRGRPLRNLSLKPGKTVTVTLATRIECSAAHPGYAFTTTVKQANDFNGSGNDFSISGPQPSLDVVGKCALTFRSQPADTQRNTSITSGVFLPSGRRLRRRRGRARDPRLRRRLVDDPVTPRPRRQPRRDQPRRHHFRDPCGGRRPTSHPGPPCRSAPRATGSTATSTGITAPAPVSNPFTIVYAGVRCAAGQSCTAASTASESHRR